jgi:hypothetical protein
LRRCLRGALSVLSSTPCSKGLTGSQRACSACPPGSTVDLAREFTLLTLNVLALTIFSDGIGEDFDGFRSAMNAYFDSIGRINVLDLLGAPAILPRSGGWLTANHGLF